MTGTIPRASPGLAAAFRGVPQPALQSLAAHAISRAFQRGEFVFRAGDPGTHLHVVDSGAVKVGAVSTSGRESVVAILGPGELIGDFYGGRQWHDARAIERSVLTVVPLDELRRCLGPRAGSDLMLGLMHRRLGQTTATLHSVIRGDTRGRIAARLCELAEYHGRPTSEGSMRLGIRLTQEDLARMTGSSRETVNKVLALFARNGWVTGSHGRYVIEDAEALRELAGV